MPTDRLSNLSADADQAAILALPALRFRNDPEAVRRTLQQASVQQSTPDTHPPHHPPHHATQPSPVRQSGDGAAVYRAAAHRLHGDATIAWLFAASARRRWWPTAGGEWALLHEAPSFAAGLHLVALFAGGVRGPARARSRAAREAIPHLCSQCGCAASCVWITPSPSVAGVAWCARCLGPVDTGDLARRSPNAPSGVWALPPPADLLRADTTQLAMTRSPYGPCGLCGAGEHGSEHLLIWCPVVSAVWTRLQPGAPPSPLRAALNGGEHRSALAVCLHKGCLPRICLALRCGRSEF